MHLNYILSLSNRSRISALNRRLFRKTCESKLEAQAVFLFEKSGFLQLYSHATTMPQNRERSEHNDAALLLVESISPTHTHYHCIVSCRRLRLPGSPTEKLHYRLSYILPCLTNFQSLVSFVLVHFPFPTPHPPVPILPSSSQLDTVSLRYRNVFSSEYTMAGT